jgi:hypothetical protein
MLKVWEVTCARGGDAFLVVGERQDILDHVNSEAYLADPDNSPIVGIRYVKTLWDQVWGKV